MAENTGSTRVTATPLAPSDGDAELLRAVQDAAAGSFAIYGELGRGKDRSVVYLAREVASGSLVALRLEGSNGEYVLDVARTLDSSIASPAIAAGCARCGAASVSGGRFCPQCGADLPASGDAARADLLAAVREAARDEYEILGEMDRAEGGGIVYFARALATGRLVTLRLRPDAADGHETSYSLGVTRVIEPLAASLGAHVAPPASPPSVSSSSSPTSPAASSSPAPGSAPTMSSSASHYEPAPAARPGATIPAHIVARPTAKRPTPQEVLIPTGQQPVDEKLPPLPRRGVPTPVIVTATVIVVAAVALVIFVHLWLSAPDATQSHGTQTLATARAAAPVFTIDSGRIELAARLPRGARVSVNGTEVTSGIALPPGTYMASVTAPGYQPLSEQLRLEPGQTVAWSPVLVPIRTEKERPSRSATQRKSAPVQSVAVQTTRAPAPTAPAPTCASSFQAKDWSSAATLCLRDAQAGNVDAERDVAVMYEQGYGVTKDQAQAAAWYRKAADGGSRDAAYQLAQMYESGRGVAKDVRQAVAWYRKAALLGDVDSEVKVGMAFENATGVDQSWEDAVVWYRKAAEQGNAWAENRLGWMYGMGRGVPRDDAEAVRLFKAAAGRGEAQAAYNLGFMYANGRGVPRSDSAAVAWYRTAARAGYGDAVKELQRRGLTP